MGERAEEFAEAGLAAEAGELPALLLEREFFLHAGVAEAEEPPDKARARSEQQDYAAGAEPQRLPVVRLHGEGERRACFVPDAVVVRGAHTEGVVAGREVEILRHTAR